MPTATSHPTETRVTDLTRTFVRPKARLVSIGLAAMAVSSALRAEPSPNAADIPSPPARTKLPTSEDTARLPLPPPSRSVDQAPNKEQDAPQGPPAAQAPAEAPSASSAPTPVHPEQPRVGAPQTPIHPTAAPAPPFATRGELQALQAQLKALQERSAAGQVGPNANPKADATTNPVDPAAVPSTRVEETAELQRRVETLEAELKSLQAATKTNSLVDPGPKQPSPSGEPSSEATKEQDDTEKLEEVPHIGLLPLEFAAFGDFYYAITEPGADDFNIGAVEIDPTFHVSPYINVAAAIAYSGSDQSFSLPAFVVDCSLYGDGEDYPLQSKYITRSGVSFGRFDVPFGVAYLEYPSVSNRLMQVPNAVNATHGSWNDLGVQGYAEAEHWTALLYVVNGSQFEGTLLDTTKPRVGAGGRLAAKIHNLVELGGSHAELFGFDGPLSFSGGDMSTTFSRFDVRGEYLVRHQKSPTEPDHTHGAYGRAVVDFAPYYLVGRYDTVFTSRYLVDRRLATGAAVEVFPQGEVRVIYEQSLNTDSRTVWFQLVGGSNFQPTGLRR